MDEDLDFYVGKKIYNLAIYDLLVKKANLSNDIDKEFFPLYRVKE